MDFWVVLAAAGAGYITKHWQNPLRKRENLSESPSRDSKFVKSKSQTLIPHLHDNNFDVEELVDNEKSQDYNVLYVSSSLPGFIGNIDLQRDRAEHGGVGGDNDESSFAASMEEIKSSHVSTRKRSLLRSRSKLRLVKPMSSLESCLMAQLYNEHASIEEYVLSSVPSPSTPTVRPFFVTDGRRIISRTKSDYFNVEFGTGEIELQKETFPAKNDIIFEVPQLPNLGSLDLPMKKEIRKGKTVNRKHFHSPVGSSEGALLFCLGISLGIISSFLANKQEVDKLNDLLKQTENLVQDLQEELEMKDSLTVKELAIEDFESQDTHENAYNKTASHASFPGQNMDESTKIFERKEKLDQKPEEHSESMSQIEAELEAELARLEINMNATSLERRLSDIGELELGLRGNVVRGELRADIFGKQVAAQPYADRDGSGSSTPHLANYAVSPHELTLRLHEVIQTRLENRIKELEISLQDSQKKLQFMERSNSWREFSSSSKVGVQSPESQQPMVINLSGEALDAYNEAYDVFTKRSESEEEEEEEEEDFPSKQDELCSFDGITHLDRCNGDEDESGADEDDEIEKLLIKHIVDRTRKGSTAVLNAETMMLFSLGENDEH